MGTANSCHACRVTERQQDRGQDTLLARRNPRPTYRGCFTALARKIKLATARVSRADIFDSQFFLFFFHNSFTNLPTTSTAFDLPTLPCESDKIINLSLTLLRTKKYSQQFLPHQKSKHIHCSIILYKGQNINTRNNPKIPVPRWAHPTQNIIARVMGTNYLPFLISSISDFSIVVKSILNSEELLLLP